MVKFERDAYRPWDDIEDQAVKTYYPRHGPRWDGWSEVLPDRTPRAIQERARRIGAARTMEPRQKKEARGGRPRHRKQEAARTRAIGKDPLEERVMRCMHEGMAPSQIDRANKWRPGKSAGIVAAAWSRDKESGLDAKRSMRDTRDD